MVIRWRAHDGPLKKKKKNVFKVGTPLTKLSGSAHALALFHACTVTKLSGSAPAFLLFHAITV